MVTHFIFMSSSYSLGTRIALDYVVKDVDMQEKLKSYLNKITGECGRDVSLSTHMIQAEDERWESVYKEDPFFKDVKVIKNVDEFIKLIKKDRQLLGIDVAKYILSKITCTQLKLQKLVYLCFADYLCETGDRLFLDKIYAFKYGPVVDTVYKRYKQYGYTPIDEEREDISNKGLKEMPAKSRILFAEAGTNKLFSIEETLRKYGDKTARELVEITHREDTPWTNTERGIFTKYPEIKLETIKKFHKNEDI